MPRRVQGATEKSPYRLSKRAILRARKLRGELPLPKKRRHKYNSKGVWIDDIYFASKAEGERYRQLKAIEATGIITRLELQPSWSVVVNNKLICRYRADFRYDVIDDRGTVLKQVVEDVKGVPNALYKLKKKLIEATHGVQIMEIPAALIDKWWNRLP
jgi:hypothetical protein